MTFSKIVSYATVVNKYSHSQENIDLIHTSVVEVPKCLHQRS